MSKRKILGKGLNALFPDITSVIEEERKEGPLFHCPIEAIIPNPFQPRKFFDPQKIEDLAASFKVSGIIQPLTVRRSSTGYELITGERRWRAALKAGLKEVPVVVKDIPDDQALKLSLIENLQREDLNPIEEAEAYRRLIEEFDLSQESVAEIVGKDRSTITNTLRLLKLPEEIREDLSRGKISSGHARAILSLDLNVKKIQLHREILKRAFSVRQAEEFVKRMRMETGKPVPLIRKEDAQITFMQENLQRIFGTQVRIVRKGKKGKIELYFFSDDDLTRIVEKIQGGQGANDN